MANALLDTDLAPDAADDLVRLTGCNPLFVSTLARAMNETGTTTELDAVAAAPKLVDFVAGRLHWLDPAGRDALAVVALGEPIGLGLLERLTDASVARRPRARRLDHGHRGRSPHRRAPRPPAVRRGAAPQPVAAARPHRVPRARRCRAGARGPPRRRPDARRRLVARRRRTGSARAARRRRQRGDAGRRLRARRTARRGGVGCRPALRRRDHPAPHPPDPAVPGRSGRLPAHVGRLRRDPDPARPGGVDPLVRGVLAQRRPARRAPARRRRDRSTRRCGPTPATRSTSSAPSARRSSPTPVRTPRRG